MAGAFSGLIQRRSVGPTQTAGRPGTSIFGGYVSEIEKDPKLTDRERYRTFSQILANTSIVAAGTRFFLNLVAKSKWTFKPSEADTDGEFAKLAQRMLMDDPKTSFQRIVRRAAMYKFYGFSWQEWTARRDEDGRFTYADIAPRAQITIERWDVDEETGEVMGVIQRNPQNQEELYIPRDKSMYIVDDTLSDSPQGLGIFRHVVAPARRLARYEQLEGWGFESDLRGIPIGRGPFAELQQMVDDGEITDQQRRDAEAPIRKFVQNHVKTSNLALLLDSVTYQTSDDRQAPSGQRQWDVELLKGSVTGFADIANAIERINLEIARILGVEGLLLGGTTGSMALSQDKSQNFFLVVESTLMELRDVIRDDLLKRIWELNGLPEDMMPTIETEAVQFKNVERITKSLRDMAQAGAVLSPTDPVINDVRTMLGVSQADMDQIEMDLALAGDRGQAGGGGGTRSGTRDDQIRDDDVVDNR